MIERRRFLKVVGAAAAVALVPACGNGGGGGVDEATGRHAAGNTSDLSVGSPRLLDDSPIVVYRDAAGVYAMSTVCTHASCDMRDSGSADASGLYCGCHGSEFDANGAVTHGPARRALPHFAVEVDAGGNLTVDADQRVSADARTPV